MSEFRSATAADFAAVLALEQACFGADDGGFSPRQLRALLANSNAYWLLRADGGAMACWLKARNGVARWARLYSLAVHPRLRGQGVAGRLLAAGADWMRREGLAICRAEVKSDNRAARELYARYGFIETAKLPDYYARGVDGVRLSLDLAPLASGRTEARKHG